MGLTSNDAASISCASLDLDAFAEDHPLSLSGGQRQRVAIAQALATNRALVVYDEPTSGLDLFHMQQVAEGIRHLRERGITQVVITHDPEFVLSCCTHVAVMDEGSIAETYPLEGDGVSRLASFFRSKYHRENVGAPSRQKSRCSSFR